MYFEETPYHDERILPSFTLRQLDLPEILKWEVGGNYYIVMKVSMTGSRMIKEGEHNKMEADFEMRSIRPVGDKPIDPTAIEKKEFEDLVGKIKSGEK